MSNADVFTNHYLAEISEVVRGELNLDRDFWVAVRELKRIGVSTKQEKIIASRRERMAQKGLSDDATSTEAYNIFGKVNGYVQSVWNREETDEDSIRRHLEENIREEVETDLKHMIIENDY